MSCPNMLDALLQGASLMCVGLLLQYHFTKND